MISKEKQEAEDIKSKICGRQHYGFITPLKEHKSSLNALNYNKIENLSQHKRKKPRKKPCYCLNKYPVLKVIIA